MYPSTLSPFPSSFFFFFQFPWQLIHFIESWHFIPLKQASKLVSSGSPECNRYMATKQQASQLPGFSEPQLLEGIRALPPCHSMCALRQGKHKGASFVLPSQQHDFTFKYSLCATCCCMVGILCLLVPFIRFKSLPSCLRFPKIRSEKHTAFSWSQFCPNNKPKRREVTYYTPLLATRCHKCWQVRSCDEYLSAP